MKMTSRFLGTSSNIECPGQTMRSKKRPCSLCTSLPTITKTSARLRASVSVVMIQPLICTTLMLRYWPSLSAWSMTPPERSASDRIARAPATSDAMPP